MPGKEKVLIAGAGPVGLIGAYKLATQGVPVTIVEPLAAPAEDLRASTFHPPTLDMLDDLGLLDWLEPRGLKSPVFQHRDKPTGEVFSFDLGLLSKDVRHPYRLQCEQWKLMGHIAELLSGMPHVEMRFGERVLGVEQDETSVRLRTEAVEGGKQQTLSGRYLIGSDGANSVIRKAMGIEFEGMTYPEKFYCATTTFPFEEHFENLSNVNYIADPQQWFVLLRVPELWRVLVPVPESMPDAEIVSDAYTQQCLQNICAREGDYAVRHRTIYRVHQRVAKEYRRGNVFLAGDSAHINNPLGGMGMNGGVHDVLNLSDKLLAVMGGANADLLDLYERQRRTVCYRYVQAQTARNKADMEEKGPEARARRLEEMRKLVADPAATHEFLFRNSMLSSLRDAQAIQ